MDFARLEVFLAQTALQMRHIHRGVFYNSESGSMKVLILMLALAFSSFAGEFAVLSTGYRLHVDHHDLDGSHVLLYQKDGGFTEMDASLVKGYETEVEPPAPPAVP